MRQPRDYCFGGVRRGTPFILLGLVAGACSSRVAEDEILALYQAKGSYPPLTVRYPLNGAVFPPEIVPPTFSWQDSRNGSDLWLILCQLQDRRSPLHFLSHRTDWTPDHGAWEDIKRRSREQAAKVTILGVRRGRPARILSCGQISIRTSPDEVGAPLFYREVNLPFLEAVKDPSRIRWRFGSISSPQPPRVVLEHLPVCGNCHSFSRDGRVLGMDVDYANNQGSYVITRVAKQMALATSDIITWDDFRKEDKQLTFGLLSQVSPDGQVVVSTVKDKSVFVARPDLAFSQLFFPIQGILVTYRRSTGAFQALPGADDPAYVQSNPSWSPDGKYIVFARSQSYQLRNPKAQGKLLLSPEDCAEFLREGKPFRYDLYRIPYNHGQGGKPEPLAGASRNGRSNYFARYSPDGKWIVFCQAKSYMLLQPDSELYLIPAEGGEARRLGCNLGRMNSWHSWSPNSCWLVFSSKAYSDYTQLWLTHLDARGESSPAVWLAHFTAPDRAANIPEFVNARPDAIKRIREQFLNDNSFARAAYTFENTGDNNRAIAEYERALAVNPQNAHAHQRLGFLLAQIKHRGPEGLAHTAEALRLDPNDGCAHCDLGMALLREGKPESALAHLARAVELMPEGFDHRYNPGALNYTLGAALIATHKFKEAAAVLAKAIAYAPNDANFHYALALAWAAQGDIAVTEREWALAKALNPGVEEAPQLHDLLSLNYAKAERFREALSSAQKALQLARESGDDRLARAIQDRIETYRQKVSAQ